MDLLNMGIPGTGPREYFSQFMGEGLELKPDMLLLSFYIGNDFNESFRDYLDENGNLIDPKKEKWFKKSYLFTFFHYFLTIQTKFEGNIFNGLTEYCDECPNFEEERFLEIVSFNRENFSPNNVLLPAMIDKAFKYIEQINEICRKQNIKFRVVIIPEEVQVSSKFGTFLFNKYQKYYKDRNWDMELPNKIFRSKLDSLGIKYLDLYPIMKNHPKSDFLYKPRDTHWNILGNQIASDEIKKFIQEDIPLNRK
ncbi:MAG TPA: hypothetical protein PK079_16675 [Leptospiraceae bacterium]|nr:hypothetical protein [Leptospiraceae bacterium]HMW07153.1 hypothetical protein [Leptospiraceae bacterium]HMX34590.1 hypothetical protein [Leptospiraceae bacterium]HMY32769.1 hypothetical protein [Leptospiraceae bacterium]HMZ65014.1 hypothetical protein [Leptospiraceae bacterium]